MDEGTTFTLPLRLMFPAASRVPFAMLIQARVASSHCRAFMAPCTGVLSSHVRLALIVTASNGGGVSDVRVRMLSRFTMPLATSRRVDCPTGRATVPFWALYTPQLSVLVIGKFPAVVPLGNSKWRDWLSLGVAARTATV